MGSNRGLESISVFSNSKLTIPRIINDRSSTSSDVSVEAILNVKHNHQLKIGGGIIDSLPGMIDNFG